MYMPTYQTVRLARGKHLSPDQGACVMELASMLAGEHFTDHPKSVCPVIAAFLRAYNDTIDAGRHADLRDCAAKVVGSRTSRADQRARYEHCLNALQELGGEIRSPWPCALRDACRPFASYGALGRTYQQLAHALRTTENGHQRAMGLVDELVAIGVDASAGPAGEKLGQVDGVATVAVELRDLGAPAEPLGEDPRVVVGFTHGRQ